MESFLQTMEGSGIDMEAFAARMKARQKSEGILLMNRGLVFENGDYDAVMHRLEPLLDSFLSKQGEAKSYPAIDLAAGSCVYTVAWAQHFQRPKFKATLEWYPTDRRGDGDPLEADLRKTLRFLKQHSEPLFADKEGKVVLAGDSVTLVGLKNAEYNSLHGVVSGPDPRSDGRFAVQLGEEVAWKSCSFKSVNILRAGDMMGDKQGVKYEEALQHVGNRESLLGGLLERSHELNILNEETWSNLAHISGKCALVTCTNLLTCLGYRNPNAWQDCLKIASKMLAPGGIFMAKDVTSDGGFGDARTMQIYVESERLELSLERMTPTRHSSIVLWCKD